jgi:hypothetical protein
MTHYGLDMAFCGGQQLHASIILLPLMEGGFCYTYRSKAISSWQTHGPRRRRTGHIPCWGEGLLAASNLLGRKLGRPQRKGEMLHVSCRNRAVRIASRRGFRNGTVEQWKWKQKKPSTTSWSPSNLHSLLRAHTL